MIKWKHSNLQRGDEVKLPDSVFICNGKRLISSRYIDETAAGLLIELVFLPPSMCEDPGAYIFKTFINWPSVYCGALKIYDGAGKEIRAVRIGGNGCVTL